MTLTEARRRLDLWLAAEEAVATGQSYTIGTRSLTRANLAQIVERVRYYQGLVSSLESGRGQGARVMRVVPRDL